MITIKTQAEIAIMRRNAQKLCEILADVIERAAPGVSTLELDEHAERLIRDWDAVPSFKGYRGFPGSVCASVNEEIVHGIPSAERVLQDGDMLSIDVGLIKDEFCADTAITVPIGTMTERVRTLIDTDAEALRLGIEQARPGNRVGDISHVIGNHIESAGFGVVKNFVGHGIGRQMHEDPSVPNFGKPGRGPKLRPGMVLAIEPMVMEDAQGTEKVLDDGWTVVTPHGGWSVHLEEMVLITDGEPELLTDGHSFQVTEAMTAASATSSS